MYPLTAAMLAIVTAHGLLYGFTPLTLTGSIITALGLSYIALRQA